MVVEGCLMLTPAVGYNALEAHQPDGLTARLAGHYQPEINPRHPK